MPLVPWEPRKTIQYYCLEPKRNRVLPCTARFALDFAEKMPNWIFWGEPLEGHEDEY